MYSSEQIFDTLLRFSFVDFYFVTLHDKYNYHVNHSSHQERDVDKSANKVDAEFTYARLLVYTQSRFTHINKHYFPIQIYISCAYWPLSWWEIFWGSLDPSLFLPFSSRRPSRVMFPQFSGNFKGAPWNRSEDHNERSLCVFKMVLPG